jgi:flagellar motor component MotA
MTHEEFNAAYFAIADRAVSCTEKARREGILSIEEILDKKKARERDIFEYGMFFVADGIAEIVIDKILSNIIAQETDVDIRRLKNIQKEAVLSINAGDNPRLLGYLLNAYTDLSFTEEVAVREKCLEDFTF